MKRMLPIALNLFFVLAASGQEIPKIKITDLEKMIAESKTPLVINFWATYCKPCMEEIPWFQHLEKKYKDAGVRFLLVSLDMKDTYPAKLGAFIKKQKIALPTAWLDETNADYFCPKIDKEWSGAIPASLFINNQEHYRKFTEKPLTAEQLEEEIRSVLSR